MGTIRIEVELTKDDHVQMQIDHANRSKTLKMMKRILVVIGIICLLLLPILIFLQLNGYDSPDAGLIGIPLVIAIVGITSPLYIGYLNKAVAASIVSEDSMESQNGPTEYELNEERISRRSDRRYEEMDWSLIRKLVETKDHIYIYDSAVSNLIIPKRDLDSKTVREVISFVESKISQ